MSNAPLEIRARAFPAERGGWEGGARDAQGRRWVHVPWQGWELDDHPPYLTPRMSWVPWWKRWRS